MVDVPVFLPPHGCPALCAFVFLASEQVGDVLRCMGSLGALALRLHIAVVFSNFLDVFFPPNPIGVFPGLGLLVRARGLN